MANNYQKGGFPIRDIFRDVPDKYHFRIHYCEDLQVARHWKILPRLINDYHLLFVRSGCGWYRINSEKYPLERGRLVFLTSGVKYEAGQDLQFPPNIIPVRFFRYHNSTGKKGADSNTPCWTTFVTNNPARHELLFTLLHHYHSSEIGNQSARGICSSLLHVIMAGIAAELNEVEVVRDARLEKAMRFIHNKPFPRYSLPELAAVARISEKYFSKLFKQSYGIPPIHYQLRLRLQRARNLIACEGMTIAESSDIAGFADPYVFSRQFKAEFGFPPSRIKSLCP